ncbi:PaaI family thioesterase [Bacillus sp. 1P02SD]|uniref:PaaI family thioesterase n=1 Tax=Bacillus sp. 1P02SD TaxID=3132264 RepID=UPI00399FAE64
MNRMCSTDDERLQTIERIEEMLHDLSPSKLVHLENVLKREKEKFPYMHYIGKWLGISESEDCMIMELGPQNDNTSGVAHGGALYSLADTAIGFAIRKQLPPDNAVFTLEMKMSFIKKGEGKKLIAKPTILQFGNRIVYSECTIFDDEGDTVAKANGSFYITKKEWLKK